MDRRQMCKLALSGGCLAVTTIYVEPYLEPFLKPLQASGQQSNPSTLTQASKTAALHCLNPEEAHLVRAIAAAMLGDETIATAAAGGKPQNSELVWGQLLVAVDLAIGGLPLPAQEELRQLLTFMGSRLFMGLTAGVWQPWSQLDAKDFEAVLTAWRFSSFSPLRTAYQALHELIMAAWYGQESAWPGIGYPGPPW